MNTEDYRFVLPMSVRDYEVDYQGIVNNANYLHYMEHTRHEFCRAEGLSFDEMHNRGIDPVLAHADIEYRNPLRMGDSFISCMNIERKGPRFLFLHDIFKTDGTPVVKAKLTIACVEHGQLSRGDILAQTFGL